MAVFSVTVGSFDYANYFGVSFIDGRWPTEQPDSYEWEPYKDYKYYYVANSVVPLNPINAMADGNALLLAGDNLNPETGTATVEAMSGVRLTTLLLLNPDGSVTPLESEVYNGWTLDGIALSADALYAAVEADDSSALASIFAEALSGDDEVYLSNGEDLFYAYGGDDIIYGYGGGDEIYAGDGDDLIDAGFYDSGEYEKTSLYGELGNDTYIIYEPGSYVLENLNEGVDTVFIADSRGGRTWAMGDNVERATLQNAVRYGITGNSIANQITGNDAINVLAGKAGNDVLSGLGGDDVLTGGSGDDRLDGGVGSDSLMGGAGNDRYTVDDVFDKVIEATTRLGSVDAGGTDLVQSSVTFNMTSSGSQFAENLTLTGNASINGTGNELANQLVGNGASNTLVGNGGADTLKGGAGKDTLTGGFGSDRFVFANGDFGGATLATGDVITDFNKAQSDKIVLSGVDAKTSNGPGDDAFTIIGTSAFSRVAGQLRYGLDANGNTFVQGDTNGDGSADFLISLTGSVALVAADFVL